MKKRSFFKHLPAHRILLYLTMLMTFWMSVMLLNPKLRINVAGAEQFSGNQQAEWEKIVDAAKKEGKIGVYLQGNKEYVKEFNRAYPKIRVVDLAVGPDSDGASCGLPENRYFQGRGPGEWPAQENRKIYDV